MTPSPGADRWLWNGDTDLYDAYLHGSSRNYDAYEDTDMFGPPPAPGDGVSYCMYHRHESRVRTRIGGVVCEGLGPHQGMAAAVKRD
jgi:hypothetical protein